MQIRFALQTVGEYGQRLFNGRRAKIFEAGRLPRFGGQSLAVERPESPGPIVANGGFVGVAIFDGAAEFHKCRPFLLRIGRRASNAMGHIADDPDRIIDEGALPVF